MISNQSNLTKKFIWLEGRNVNNINQFVRIFKVFEDALFLNQLKLSVDITKQVIKNRIDIEK